jgi:hypothetical protein
MFFVAVARPSGGSAGFWPLVNKNDEHSKGFKADARLTSAMMVTNVEYNSDTINAIGLKRNLSG